MRENAARHPDHDPRVALPDALLGRARDPRPRRGGDRRRDPRRRPVQARLAPGADAGAARAAGEARGRDATLSSGSGSRRRSGRWSGSLSSWSGRSGSARSSTRGGTKELDLEIVVPVEDMSDPGAPAFPERGRRPAAEGRAHRPRPLDLARDLPGAAAAGPGAHLDDHLRQQPPRRRAPREAAERAGERAKASRSCRRPSTRGHAAERILELQRSRPGGPARARVEIARAHHGSLSHEERDPRRGAAEVGPAALPGRHLLAGAGDRHGRRRPGDPGRVAEVGHPRPAADRPRRPRARRGLQGPDLPQVPRRPARVRGGRQADARRARSRRR